MELTQQPFFLTLMAFQCLLTGQLRKRNIGSILQVLFDQLTGPLANNLFQRIAKSRAR